jgi:hypothetical protein
VEQDHENYLRFDYYSDGSSTFIFAGSTTGGVLTHRVNTPVYPNGATPLYMRVKRQGNQWTQSYSNNGSTWTTSVVFLDTLVVDSVGAYVANEGTNPAHTANIDYFFNTASPIVPEDGGTATSPPIITQQPTNRTVMVGQTATFSVRAGGTAPLSYQWQKNSVNIGGATDTSYTTPVTTLVDSGAQFRCAVTNSLGSDTSSQATLTVTTQSPTVIDVWYGPNQTFGHIGIPQRAINILGNVSDPTGIASLSYTLNGGPAISLSRGPDTRRLLSPGDFNADIDYSSLLAGSNQVVITATTNGGWTKSDTVTVQFAGGNVWPLPDSIKWSTVSSIQSVAQIVDGLWSLDGDSIRPTLLGYDRMVAIGDTTWTDYEVTVPITIRRIDSAGYASPSNGPGVGIVMRWKGNTDNPIAGLQPKEGYLPFGAIGYYRYYTDFSEGLEIYGPSDQLKDTTGIRLSFNTQYIFKMRVETNPGVGGLYRFKVWPSGNPEPTGWNLSKQQSLSDLQAGSFMLLSHHVDASFGNVIVTTIPPDTTAPVISNIQVTPHATTATVTWATDKLSTSKVSYGPSSAYENGSVNDSTLVTQHSITLPSLTPETLYHFQVTSVNSFSVGASSSDSTFTTAALPPASTLVSDEFNAPSLNGIWTFINPRGDATLTMTGTQVSISIPAGTNHDVWTDGNFAPRIMQAANNTDFEVTMKFDSPMTAGYQMLGLIAQQDASNYLRFDFVHSSSMTRIYAASFAGGSVTVRKDSAITNGSPLYLRVKREGNQWTESFSYNGTSWTTAVSFSYTLVISSVGPFVGNYGNPESSAPAFTGLIDYFRTAATTANLKAFLEGPFMTPGDSMRTSLLQQGYVPLRQPYSGSPWNYSGTDSVASIPGGVVDWVLVELRTDTSAASKVATRAAFIKGDGSIVDLNGVSPVAFANIGAGNYYAVVRHRNHLAIMSASAVVLSASSGLYDFTTSQSQAHGTNPMKLVGTRYVMYAGDGNQSGIVTASDANAAYGVINTPGYNVNDINLSGIVTAADANVVFGNLNKAAQVP